MENRELNLLGAELLGYDVKPVNAHRLVLCERGSGVVQFEVEGDGYYRLPRWNPCEDLNQAWKVIQAVRHQADVAVLFGGCGAREGYRVLSILSKAFSATLTMGDPKEVCLTYMRAVAEARAETPQSLKEREGLAD